MNLTAFEERDREKKSRNDRRGRRRHTQKNYRSLRNCIKQVHAHLFFFVFNITQWDFPDKPHCSINHANYCYFCHPYRRLLTIEQFFFYCCKHEKISVSLFIVKRAQDSALIEINKSSAHILLLANEAAQLFNVKHKIAPYLAG